MAGRPSLGKISEEGNHGSTSVVEDGVKEEENCDKGEDAPKEKKIAKSKARKTSVFTQDMKPRNLRSTFTLVHTDQPLPNRVTFAPSQSDGSEHSGRRVSGYDNHASNKYVHRATYQIAPRKEFSVSQVTKIIKETLETGLSDKDLFAPRSVLCKNLAEAIKLKTRRLNYDRYRIIVHVFISSKENVTLKISSRCVWDEKIDNYADYMYETEDFYALGIAYGVYKE